MRKGFNVALQRPGWRSIFYEAGFLTAYVLFFLIAFQPFGTYEYDHPYKIIQLGGYGLIVALCYPVLRKSLSGLRYNNYFLKHEALVLMSSFLIIIFLAFFYHGLVIMRDFSWKNLPVFGRFGIIFMVPPFCALLYHGRYKANKKDNGKLPGEKLEIKGTNLSEQFFFNTTDVFYLRSNGNYVMIYFQKDGLIKYEMVRNTLSQVSEQLHGTDFVSAHRSFMVNARKFDCIVREEGKHLLVNRQFDIRLPVSRNNVSSIEEKLRDHS